jgi:hypothetical protein
MLDNQPSNHADAELKAARDISRQTRTLLLASQGAALLWVGALLILAGGTIGAWSTIIGNRLLLTMIAIVLLPIAALGAVLARTRWLKASGFFALRRAGQMRVASPRVKAKLLLEVLAVVAIAAAAVAPMRLQDPFMPIVLFAGTLGLALRLVRLRLWEDLLLGACLTLAGIVFVVWNALATFPAAMLIVGGGLIVTGASLHVRWRRCTKDTQFAAANPSPSAGSKL